ncbi:hypothetical protein [Actinoplanes sp. G11-F43]|uniref:hypothetical protein n=1 Tax=Actinoplanes sp. G11-F43 TaxID=3424130 RepID=UPI003D32F0DB
MSEWQPPREVATDLVYRSLFTSPEPDLRERAAELFAAWATGKNVPVDAGTLLDGGSAEAESDGTRRIASGSVGAYSDRAGGQQLEAAVFRLEEHPADGSRWTTSLRIAVPHQTGQKDTEQPWVWLDLEHRRTPDTAPVRPGSPRLIRDLLAAVEGVDASLPLTAEVLTITESHVGELCGWLFDTGRRVPVIVFSPDPQMAEQQERFAAKLARDVTGVAVVVRLRDASAAAAFSRRVGPHLHVYGGGMRTYLPGLVPNEPFPRRHRILSAASMRALGQRSANAVRDQVLALSTRRAQPASYVLVRRALSRGSAEVERNALQDLLRKSQREAADEIAMLYAEVDDLTAQLAAEQVAREQVEDVRLQWELGEIELNDLERDNDRLQARVRWLESQLATHQVHVAGQETPDRIVPPGQVVEVLELAAARLPHLVIGPTADAAAGLDVHPQAERWALKVWQALTALNAYAAARAAGTWRNSFLAWCQEPPSGGIAVPATWVALSESETTGTTPRLRESRTFPVPAVVDPARRVFMQAHVKIQQGGSPCPRLHFHDDTGGRTGQVHVGYVGDHLPTANFR